MNENISYRVVNPKNAQKIINDSIVSDMLKIKFGEMDISKSIPYFKKDLLNDFSKKNQRLFLIKDGNSVVGYSIGEIKGDSFFKKFTGVHLDYRKTNLSKKLLIYTYGFLRTRENIKKIDGYKVINPKMFSLNKQIVNRKGANKYYELKEKKDDYFYKNKKTNKFEFHKKNHIVTKKPGK